MADNARSADPAVQSQLDRLWRLSPGADILGLERITALLNRLDNPHDRLPPVFHVAGTNGKGSTCAFLRAALEAEGHKVHVFTSPHLVRFNERIRLAGRLIDDPMLARGLAHVLDRGEDIGASFFEVTTALAYHLFAQIPADACVVEVGLGGRLDATNVLTNPVATGIAQLGIDHQAFLGNSLTGIAREKAGIAKAGTPMLTQRYPKRVRDAVADEVAARGGRLSAQHEAWDIVRYGNTAHYRDAQGKIALPLPVLAGAHQINNLGLAIAMLRHQDRVSVQESALKAAPRWAQWPARLQRLESGPLLTPIGHGRTVWLDGGHNPAAGIAIADYFHKILEPGQKLTLVIGMLANKDAEGFLMPLRDRTAAIHVVPVPDHQCHDDTHFQSIAAPWSIPVIAQPDARTALQAIGQNSADAILICGSLYLAGEILRENDQSPE